MKLYTKGVLVVGMAQIDVGNNEKKKPYENSGIEQGDIILEVNNSQIKNTQDLIDEVNNSEGKPLTIKYSKNEQTLNTSITPIKTNNEYKIGLWVRDATAGVGTLTFYEPSTNLFMSLGHGITDIDTEKIVDIATGELITANIVSINKGRKGIPGEIRGTIDTGNTIGKIYKNTNFGVYGLVTNKNYLNMNTNEEIEVASREEIKEGKAEIICQLDNNTKRKYNIEIERVYRNNNQDNKSMLIKITDQELLEKTGGIIQGMSGAPIIQNGKFIGAVTNVLVNDPTGDGILTSLMLIKVMLEEQKTASELCEIIKMYPQVLVNAKVSSDKKNQYKEDKEIQEEIEKLEKEFAGNGRVLIRPSGTEPLIRVMIEGENQEYIKEKAERLAKLIEEKLN